MVPALKLLRQDIQNKKQYFSNPCCFNRHGSSQHSGCMLLCPRQSAHGQLMAVSYREMPLVKPSSGQLLASLAVFQTRPQWLSRLGIKKAQPLSSKWNWAAVWLTLQSFPLGSTWSLSPSENTSLLSFFPVPYPAFIPPPDSCSPMKHTSPRQASRKPDIRHYTSESSVESYQNAYAWTEIPDLLNQNLQIFLGGVQATVCFKA